MRLDQLKRGLWGYKKDSVYHCIAQLEEEASEKLLKKDRELEELAAQTRKQLEELRQSSAQMLEEKSKQLEALSLEFGRQLVREREAAARKLEEKDRQLEQSAARAGEQIAALEESLRLLQADNEAMRREQAHISETLVDAQKYARQIRAQAQSFEQESRAKLQAELDQQMAELDEYAAMTGKLKQNLCQLLSQAAEKAEKLDQELSALRKNRPSSRLVDITKLLNRDMG